MGSQNNSRSNITKDDRLAQSMQKQTTKKGHNNKKDDIGRNTHLHSIHFPEKSTRPDFRRIHDVLLSDLTMHEVNRNTISDADSR